MQQTVNIFDFIFDIIIRGVVDPLANLTGLSQSTVQVLIGIAVFGLFALFIARIVETFRNWIFNKPELIEPTPLLFNEELNPITAQVLVGREGVVQAPLRPLGNVQLDGRTYVVKSEGHYIEPGTPVRVDRIEGPHIIVVPVMEKTC